MAALKKNAVVESNSHLTNELINVDTAVPMSWREAGGMVASVPM